MAKTVSFEAYSPFSQEPPFIFLKLLLSFPNDYERSNEEQNIRQPGRQKRRSFARISKSLEYLRKSKIDECNSDGDRKFEAQPSAFLSRCERNSEQNDDERRKSERIFTLVIDPVLRDVLPRTLLELDAAF